VESEHLIIFAKVFAKFSYFSNFCASNFRENKTQLFFLTLFVTYGDESREAGQHQQDPHPATQPPLSQGFFAFRLRGRG